LDEGVQQEDVGRGEVDSLLLVDADYLSHGHHDIDLQSLYLLLFEKASHGGPCLGGQGHDRNGIEGDGQRIESVGEGVVEQQKLIFAFAKVDRRVVCLVRVQDGVDLSGEAGLKLLMYKFHHAVQDNLG